MLPNTVSPPTATTLAAIPSRTIKPRGIDQFSLPDSVGIVVGASTAGFPFLENTGFLCPAPDMECSHDHEEAEQACVPTQQPDEADDAFTGRVEQNDAEDDRKHRCGEQPSPTGSGQRLHLEGADTSEDSEHAGVTSEEHTAELKSLMRYSSVYIC